MDTVRQVSRWVAAAERITVLTGAGISTDSGIPDFRGPQGMWTTNPAAQRMFSLDGYVADRDVRVQAWRRRRDHPAWTARPNAGHRALVDLERMGRLRAVVTQNIDGLHQRAGSAPSIVMEIHGTVWRAECLGCGRRMPMSEALARVDAGDEDPACTDCGGLLKSATISFGQQLRPEVWQAAVAAAKDCDLFLAVGSSLQVHPAASLCDLARGAGARLVVVNAEPTPYDAAADAVVRARISTALPALVDSVESSVPGPVNRR
ncbi:MAG: SIR2 family NAD-dependent protein deacylase [Jiangellaceae bacterium]